MSVLGNFVAYVDHPEKYVRIHHFKCSQYQRRFLRDHKGDTAFWAGAFDNLDEAKVFAEGWKKKSYRVHIGCYCCHKLIRVYKQETNRVHWEFTEK